jgi:hypothetical protein
MADIEGFIRWGTRWRRRRSMICSFVLAQVVAGLCDIVIMSNAARAGLLVYAATLVVAHVGTSLLGAILTRTERFVETGLLTIPFLPVVAILKAFRMSRATTVESRANAFRSLQKAAVLVLRAALIIVVHAAGAKKLTKSAPMLLFVAISMCAHFAVAVLGMRLLQAEGSPAMPSGYLRLI